MKIEVPFFNIVGKRKTKMEALGRGKTENETGSLKSVFL